MSSDKYRKSITGNSAARRLSVDPWLLSLVAIAVLINLPALLGYILPMHDTMFMFQTFYYFYNNLFVAGDIPRWLLFGLYGVQSDNSLIAILSPATYFVGAIGYVAGIKDVLFLFHLSLLVEELIFLFGIYLLAGCLFARKSTVFIVSLTALCGSFLMVQFLLNFHIYSMLPIMIYLLIKAFRTCSYRHIALSMLVFIISLFGNPPYFAPIPALAMLVVFVALFISSFKDLRGFLRPSKTDIIATVFFFSTFIVVAALYYWFISNAMNHTHGIYIGRDPVTLKTDLSTFLKYANDSAFEKFKGLVWPSKFFFDDLTLHVGFVTLLFALFGLVTARRAISLSFVAVMVVFGLLSLGGKTPVAEFLYHHFPMMDYFRHIRDVVSNYKLFIPLLAGFGLERYLALVKNGGDERRWLALAGEALSAAAVLAGSIVYSAGHGRAVLIYAAGATIVFLAALYLLRYRFGVLRHTVHFLIACFLFQMLSYQALANATMYSFAKRVLPIDKSVTSIHDYTYQDIRTELPYEKRVLDASAFLSVSRINYSFVYNFLLWDPCFPIKRIDFLNENVYEYFKLKQVELVDINPRNNTFGKRLLFPADRNFFNSIGCNSPKLKLFKNVVFSDSVKESGDMIREMPMVDRVIILNGVDEKERARWPSASPFTDNFARGKISVKGFSANRLSLEVEVGEKDGAWLYYADAFHPGWKAYVNGAGVPVAQANIAFKAIPLGPGNNSVELVFRDEPARTIGRVLILCGVIFTATVLAILCGMCLFDPRSPGGA